MRERTIAVRCDQPQTIPTILRFPNNSVHKDLDSTSHKTTSQALDAKTNYNAGMEAYFVIGFYRFIHIDDRETLRPKLLAKLEDWT